MPFSDPRAGLGKEGRIVKVEGGLFNKLFTNALGTTSPDFLVWALDEALLDEENKSTSSEEDSASAKGF